MNAVVVYESVYGNTRAIGEAIAEGLGGARVVSVANAGQALDASDLLVVGGPTHIHALATSRSRQMAVDAAQEDGHAVEPDAAADPGLRRWLSELPKVEGIRAATFDTRLDRSAMMTGTAARGIARRLRHRGYDVVARESFLVEDSEGPLAEGELGRAREWGAGLAEELAAAV
jgi:Flavodoxin domain